MTGTISWERWGSCRTRTPSPRRSMRSGSACWRRGRPFRRPMRGTGRSLSIPRRLSRLYVALEIIEYSLPALPLELGGILGLGVECLDDAGRASYRFERRAHLAAAERICDELERDHLAVRSRQVESGAAVASLH